MPADTLAEPPRSPHSCIVPTEFAGQLAQLLHLTYLVYVPRSRVRSLTFEAVDILRTGCCRGLASVFTYLPYCGKEASPDLKRMGLRCPYRILTYR